jgi:hypothetical protein
MHAGVDSMKADNDSTPGIPGDNPPADLLAIFGGLTNLRLRVRADEDTGCIEARCFMHPPAARRSLVESTKGATRRPPQLPESL